MRISGTLIAVRKKFANEYLNEAKALLLVDSLLVGVAKYTFLNAIIAIDGRTQNKIGNIWVADGCR